MVSKKQVYRCNVCGNIVEILRAGGGELVCCGQPMELLQEKTADAALEKRSCYRNDSQCNKGKSGRGASSDGRKTLYRVGGDTH